MPFLSPTNSVKALREWMWLASLSLSSLFLPLSLSLSTLTAIFQVNPG